MRQGAAALCAVAIAACKGPPRDAKVAPDAGAAAAGEEAWLKGSWKKIEDADGLAVGWLLFLPPRDVAALGKRTLLGTYVARGTKVSLMVPLTDGSVGESGLEASPDRRRLTWMSARSGKRVVWERRSETSELEGLGGAPSARDDGRGLSAEDLSWLSGTWKQDGAARWLLFNPPRDVVELGGKPATAMRRGTLVAHGKYVSALFAEGELRFESPPDHSRLTTSSPPTTWRRGNPPP